MGEALSNIQFIPQSLQNRQTIPMPAGQVGGPTQIEFVPPAQQNRTNVPVPAPSGGTPTPEEVFSPEEYIKGMLRKLLGTGLPAAPSGQATTSSKPNALSSPKGENVEPYTYSGETIEPLAQGGPVGSQKAGPTIEGQIAAPSPSTAAIINGLSKLLKLGSGPGIAASVLTPTALNKGESADVAARKAAGKVQFNDFDKAVAAAKATAIASVPDRSAREFQGPTVKIGTPSPNRSPDGKKASPRAQAIKEAAKKKVDEASADDLNTKYLAMVKADPNFVYLSPAEQVAKMRGK
jgi:hypothetical protein